MMLMKGSLSLLRQRCLTAAAGPTALPRASIFTKGTDLDTKKYDQERSKEEQLITYYRNHMESDKISEEEKAEYEEKVKELLEKHQKQDASMKAQQTQKEQTKQATGTKELHRQLDMHKIKNMFD